MLYSTIKLGVTGLARSGKTVFISSLIHNLLRGGRLPFLSAHSEGRIKRVYLVPQPDDDIPRFSYERHISCIVDERDWPQSTNRISQLRLAVEFETNDFIFRQFGTYTLYIDIIDYPGEWLLDLPLLELSYEDWSFQALELAMSSERQGISEDWVKCIKSLDPHSFQDEGVVEKASELFKSYLIACRSKDHALSTVPPGRFVMPGDMEGSPALTFSPLILPRDGSAQADTLWAMMRKRFEAYKTHVIKPFFYNHFSQLDRQIILVDALHVINAGEDAIRDMQRALRQILRCFNTGKNSWYNYIWNKKIDRIVFAATKADQLHHTSHDRLEHIMTMLTDDAVKRAEFSGADIKGVALASIRSTREGEVSQNGDVLPCVIGTPMKGTSLGSQFFNGEEEVAVFPGDLPGKAKDVYSMVNDGGKLQFVDFRPPSLADDKRMGDIKLPHIRLDRVLEFLMGDKLT